MERLELGGDCVESEQSFGHFDLAALTDRCLIPDVSTLVEGRSGKAVRLSALAELAGIAAETRFVHVASSDGSFTANLDLEPALQNGFVIFELAGAPLPQAQGGPFRLLFADNDDCSVNVKYLRRVEFVREPGDHSAACSD